MALRPWPAADCHLVRANIISCAEAAESRHVEDCREYCVDLLVKQDHFKSWPEVPLERKDACTFENRCGNHVLPEGVATFVV